MSALIITGNRNRLYVNGRFLALSNPDEPWVLQTFAPHDLPFDVVILDARSHGSLTFDAVRWIVSDGVPVHLLDCSGRILGSFLPAGPTHAKVKLAQYRASLDPSVRLKVALSFITEKLSKSRQLLEFLRRHYPSVSLTEFDHEARFHSSAPRQLLTAEARCARAYYTQFVKVISKVAPDLAFNGRGGDSPNNMNAVDPVNAMMNYGFGILQGIVRTAVHSTGLDPALGFLHEPMGDSGTSNPLVYDWMECYRPCVDYVILDLLRRHPFSRSDFSWTNDYRCEVGPAIGRTLIESIYAFFNRRTEVGGQRKSFQTLVERDGRSLVRFLMGDAHSLSFSKPFPLDDASIDAELSQRLLSMTVEERKRLGITKTTYHYIRKSLKGEKVPRRLYAKTLARIQRPQPKDLAGTPLSSS